MGSSYVSSEKTLSLYSHWERAKSIAGFWDVIICNKMSTLCSQREGARFGLYPTKIFIKIKQASRRLKRLACRMTMLTVMTMFLIYPFTLSHEHRHHRHHRHAYSEMTLAVYYCSKQKQWYYEKHKIRMTQMTLMTLNPGYGIGISSKQRHKRHQRHYRHTRAARGSGDSPEMRLWISKRYASKTRSSSKRE